MIKLTLFLCSLYAGTCMPPYTVQETYADNFSCMLDGYQKSYEKMVQIGAEETNTAGLYIRFVCQDIEPKIPQPKDPAT